MSTVLLGIGTNMGDRMENINAAVRSVGLLPRTVLCDISHVYETDPVGYLDQPRFLNAVLKIDTELSATAVLGACLGIEAALGRVRTIKDGPRVIDIDVLIYDGVRSDSHELTLPHPRMAFRSFVMVPLSDLYPSGRAPMMSFSQKLKDIGLDGVTRYEREADLYIAVHG